MVNAAIAHQRWDEVLYWINRVSGLEAGKSRNQYWLARAQQQLGQPHSFAELATRRDYYGFMAAAQVNADIELNAAPANPFLMQMKCGCSPYRGSPEQLNFLPSATVSMPGANGTE